MRVFILATVALSIAFGIGGAVGASIATNRNPKPIVNTVDQVPSYNDGYLDGKADGKAECGQ